MLKRIEVKNFKSLKHIDFKCAGLNLLMGLNGAGKSSFVQLLLFLKSIANKSEKLSVEIPLKLCGEDVGKYSDLKYCYANESDSIVLDVEFKAHQFSAIDIVQYGSGITEGILRRVVKSGRAKDTILIENPVKSACDAEYDTFVKTEVARFRAEGKTENETFAKFFKHIHNNRDYVEQCDEIKKEGEKKCEVAAQRDASIAEAYESVWRNVKFVSSYRERPHSVYSGDELDASIVLRGKLSVCPDGSDIAEFLHKFGDLIEVKDDFKSLPSPMLHPDSEWNDDAEKLKRITLNEQVRLWLNEVSPGAHLYVDKVQVADLEKFVLSVGFCGDNDCSHKFKPQNVGFGISYVLPVLVTLLTSQQDEVVIIENPEAHLHPKGQASMGNLIARAVASGVQVFVETHSDHVVNGIRAAIKDGIVKPSDVSIAFFERKEHDLPNEDGTTHQEIYSEVRNIRVDKNGSLSEYPDGFLDEWNNQLMELI